MKSYIQPNQEAIANFNKENNLDSPIVMLNLLRFKKQADYSKLSAIKPDESLTGEQAYHVYMKYTQPILQKLGAEVVYLGKSSAYLIGPTEETWDMVLLVKYATIQKFYDLIQDPTYLKTAGHRSAAVEDSRLLPMKG